MEAAFLITYRPPANKPKPNTRFLRNIIKDTDNHNAALLAKEAVESRARLERLVSSGPRAEKAIRVGGGDIRKRQLGQIAAILGGPRPSKRKRTEDEQEKKSARIDDPRRANVSSEDEEPEGKPRSAKRKDREPDERRKEGRHERSHRSHRRHGSASLDREKDRLDRKRRDRSRSRSPREHRSKDYRSRKDSPRRNRSRSGEREMFKIKGESRRARRSPSPRMRLRREDDTPVKKSASKPEYDSDPLDDIIGPRPAPVPQVRTRGRGTISQASGINSRFSSNYDPTADVQLDPDEENDWDQALEALRDRQKWKQQGADRLRAAGFTEEEVKKWEKGGEKREEDVKWAKKGEGREWDRGKVFDDGGVAIDSKFGRLKDT